MTAQKRKRNAISKDRLVKLLQRHKKIKVVVNDCFGRNDQCRERILTATGSSIMRSKYDDHLSWPDGVPRLDKAGRQIIKTKYTRYRTSCFCYSNWKKHEDYGNYAPAKAVVYAMFDNDSFDDLSIVSVFVGKGFKRKII